MHIKIGGKYGDSGWISSSPTEKELEKKSVPQLIAICTARRWNRNPFKKTLISYILSLGELKL